ncbi:MAG: phosphate ABC transporter permease subunit PstC [Moraxellaceae bacterium]|nr:phosphate ABC transporter permease subunit PstC [Moraxellaceae bacterium]
MDNVMLREGGVVMGASTSDRLKKKRLRNLRESFIESLLFLAAFVSVVTTVGIVYILVSESLNFFAEVPLVDFLTDTQWTPLFADAHFGIMVLISGTLTSAGVALAVALPLGTIIAIYLSEFATFSVREAAKPVLELLGGVPTIVFGYFALIVVTPALQKIFPSLPGFNILSAGLVMGVMIIPYVASLAEDAMRAVPMSLREGSYAMGATRLQTALRVVLPAAISGVASAYVLAISRAVGETMILTVAAGSQPLLTFNPADSAMTLASYIAGVSMGDLPHDSIGYKTIFAAGLTLMLMTLALNIFGHWLRKRYREVY